MCYFCGLVVICGIVTANVQCNNKGAFLIAYDYTHVRGDLVLHYLFFNLTIYKFKQVFVYVENST